MPEWPPAVSRELIKRTLNVVGLVCLVAVIVPFAVFGVPQVVGADHSYVVLSGSMDPAIQPGDAVIVDAVPPEQIEAGDVITFRRGGEVPTTHRVVEVVRMEGGLEFVTKGDANEDADTEPVPARAVTGRVALTIPLIGHVIVFARSNYGVVALVGIPIVLFVLNEIWLHLAEDPSRSTDGATATAAKAGDSTADEDSAGGSTAGEATVPAGGPDMAHQYSLTGRDLGLTMLVLGVVVPYSAWMLYLHRDVISSMVFVGGLTGLGLVLWVRLVGPWMTRTSSGDATSEPVSDGGGSVEATSEAPSEAVSASGVEPDTTTDETTEPDENENGDDTSDRPQGEHTNED